MTGRPGLRVGQSLMGKRGKCCDWQACWPGGWDTAMGTCLPQRKELWDAKNDTVAHVPWKIRTKRAKSIHDQL